MQSGIAYLSITIPLDILDQVRNFFDSSIAISSYLKKQVQIRLAMEKVNSAAYREDIKKKGLIFSELILSNFDLFTSQGSSPRIAIRQTRDLLNSRGEDLTCSIVELVVRKAGRLSKRKKVENTPLKKQKGKAAVTVLPSVAAPFPAKGKEVSKCKLPHS